MMNEQQANFGGLWLSLTLAEQKVVRALAVMSFGELGVPLPDLEEAARLDTAEVQSVTNKLRELGYVETGKLLSKKEDSQVEVVNTDDFLTADNSVDAAMKTVRATFKGKMMINNYKEYKNGLEKK